MVSVADWQKVKAVTLHALLADTYMRDCYFERIAIRIFDARMTEAEAIKLTKQDYGVDQEDTNAPSSHVTLPHRNNAPGSLRGN